MGGGKGTAELNADRDHLVEVERPPFAQLLFECLAVDVFHPHADLVVDALRPIDRDDVGVTHASQEAAFFYNVDAWVVTGLSAPQDLERDLTVEPRVPRAEDLAEGTTANFLDDPQRTPCVARSVLNRSITGECGAAIGDVCDELQFGE